MRHACIASITVAAVLLALDAPARDDGGQLAMVLSPNNTQPVFVRAGGSFHVLITDPPSTLRLESANGAYPLRLDASKEWRGAVLVPGTVPENTPPGAYALAAETGRGTDVVHRAVYVQQETLEDYTVAHLTNLRIGAPGARDTALYRTSAEIRRRGADLVVVSGDLTADGKPDQWRVALDILNDCGAPTLVAPGPRDVAGGLSERFLGPYPLARHFGPDGYLLWPAPHRSRPDRITPYLHVARRSILASRWSFGVTQRGEMPGATAADTITLIDTPLDAILFGAADKGESTESPWGPTKLLYPLNDDRGSVTWYRASLRASGGLERIDPP